MQSDDIPSVEFLVQAKLTLPDPGPEAQPTAVHACRSTARRVRHHFGPAAWRFGAASVWIAHLEGHSPKSREL
jgi:hypothetical protein